MSEGRNLPGGVSSVTPSAANRNPVWRWRGLRQISLIHFSPPSPVPVILSRWPRLSAPLLPAPSLTVRAKCDWASGSRSPPPSARPTCSPLLPLVMLGGVRTYTCVRVTDAPDGGFWDLVQQIHTWLIKRRKKFLIPRLWQKVINRNVIINAILEGTLL